MAHLCGTIQGSERVLSGTFASQPSPPDVVRESASSMGVSKSNRPSLRTFNVCLAEARSESSSFRSSDSHLTSKAHGPEGANTIVTRKDLY